MGVELARKGIEPIKNRRHDSFLVNKRFCVNRGELEEGMLALRELFAFVPRIDLMAWLSVPEALSSGTDRTFAR